VRRVFIPEGCASSATVGLTGPEAHYLLRVLRMQPGDRFRAVLPGGGERVATVKTVTGERVAATLGEELAPGADPSAEVHLYVGMAKTGKLELVIQKCTELGVASVRPVLCRRSVSRPDSERAARKVGRWEKIAEEAARQCGRTSAPHVGAPLGFVEAVEEMVALNGTGLILAPTGERGLREAALRPPVSLLTGPEGGFDPEELSHAADAGLTSLSLGERILRAETAAIAATALVMYELGELV